MTKQLKSVMWQIASLCYAMLLIVASAQAQDTYIPPPLFEAPQAVPAQDPAFQPRYSPYTPPSRRTTPPDTAEKYTNDKNPLLPPVVTDGDPAVKKSAPKQTTFSKPPMPIAKPAIPPPPVQPEQAVVVPRQVIAPTKAVKKERPVAAPSSRHLPAARITSEGVVTGPKTMPSVPTTDVSTESTFTTDLPAAQTMMERHQTQSQAAPLPAMTATEALPTRRQSVKTLSLPFEKGGANLESPPLGDIVDSLLANPGAHVMISAYASPVDDGENSDRRIALARGLALRKELVAAGVDSQRIDIRALGRKVPGGAVDRVDLTLINTRKSAD